MRGGGSWTPGGRGRYVVKEEAHHQAASAATSRAGDRWRDMTQLNCECNLTNS